MLDKIFYNVGVEDYNIDLFEGLYFVPNGVTYNSYVVAGDKLAVIDSVDVAFGNSWLKNLTNLIGDRKPDYLIIQHMEPDHSGSLKKFIDKYPDVTVVGNQKTFVMAGEYFGEGFAANRLVVKDGDTLDLGGRILKFVFAPMVHWPEVMFIYEEASQTLFSADAFGSFGTDCKGWDDEARRYYVGIVGKYGVQVASVLKKLEGCPISTVAPLHGKVLSGNSLAHALELYNKWATYQPEVDGVLIVYSSVYGHTTAAAKELSTALKNKGVKVKMLDAIRDDWAVSISQAFKYSNLVIASPTYNGDIFPAAREFIDKLVERNYQNRRVAFIENGSWAPVCAKLMQARMQNCKNLIFAQNVVRVRSALNEESRAQILALAEELSKNN